MLAIPPRITRRTWALLVVAGTTGCEIPNFAGPQIQEPPPGFNMQPDTHLERRMFPELATIHHDAWVNASWGNFSGIYINGHAEILSQEDAEDARLAAVRHYSGALIEFGELESLTVDGRTAWGWTEWWRLENGGLDYVAYRAVVPYDTMSYALEFISGDPSLKIRPDSLRTVLASFAIGETEVDLPVLAVLGGAMLLLLSMMRSRMSARVERARTITLVKVPTKGPGGKGPGGKGPGGEGGGPAPNVTVAESIAKALEQGDRSPPSGPPPPQR